MDRDNLSKNLLIFLMLISSLLVYQKLPVVHLAIYNFSLPLLALFLVFMNRRHAAEAFRYHRLALLFLAALYASAWVSAILSPHTDVATKYTAKYSAYFIVLVSFLLFAYRQPGRLSRYRTAYRFLFALAVFGFLEFLFPHSRLFHWLRSPGSLAVYPRISSIMQWPNQLGVLMGIGLILAILLRREKSIKSVEFCIASFSFFAVDALTASRNGWLVLAIGLFLLWIYNVFALKRVLLILGVLGCLILLFPASRSQLGSAATGMYRMARILTMKCLSQEPHAPDSSGGVDSGPAGVSQEPHAADSAVAKDLGPAGGRLVLWSAAIREIARRPFAGLGMEVFEKCVGSELLPGEGYNAHNIVLNILVELGVAGFLLVVLFLYSLFRKTDFRNPLVAIPLFMVFLGQMIDFFLYDYTFTTLALFILAEAANSRTHGDA